MKSILPVKLKQWLARKYGIEIMLFRILVGIYEKHGRKGLYNSPLITGKLRIKIVESKQKHHASIVETCVQFAFRSPGIIGKWETVYLNQGRNALLEMHKGVRPYNKQRITATSEKLIKRELILAHTKRSLKKD